MSVTGFFPRAYLRTFCRAFTFRRFLCGRLREITSSYVDFHPVVAHCFLNCRSILWPQDKRWASHAYPLYTTAFYSSYVIHLLAIVNLSSMPVSSSAFPFYGPRPLPYASMFTLYVWLQLFVQLWRIYLSKNIDFDTLSNFIFHVLSYSLYIFYINHGYFSNFPSSFWVTVMLRSSVPSLILLPIRFRQSNFQSTFSKTAPLIPLYIL